MRIALIGYGVEGACAYRYFHRLHATAEFHIYENAEKSKAELPPGVVFHGGVKDFTNIDADIVVRTPSVAPERISTTGRLTSVTKAFFAECPLPIIGVTGTKGKGTTASLIARILQETGMKAWLVGNIGTPALDVLDEVRAAHEAGEAGVVVYELSSFQLWDMTASPQTAVVLMVEPEHLDVHVDFADYAAAKANIARYQRESDAVVYYEESEVSCKIAELSAGKKIGYGTPHGDVLTVNGETVVHRSDIALYGAHNVGNVQAAILAAWQYTTDKAAIIRAVRDFSGLPHRLEPVSTKDDVLFVNDSFSSAPPATVAAAGAFDRPVILIMGGYDRELDFAKTAHALVRNPNLKHAVLIGQNRGRIAAAFDAEGWSQYTRIDGDLQVAVERARELAHSGDVVILSPGSASFDMFKNFTERGNQFKEIVGLL